MRRNPLIRTLKICGVLVISSSRDGAPWVTRLTNRDTFGLRQKIDLNFR